MIGCFTRLVGPSRFVLLICVKCDSMEIARQYLEKLQAIIEADPGVRFLIRDVTPGKIWLRKEGEE